MYTGTLIGMLIANALYGTIVARMSRRRFIPIAYRFAILNLFIFFVLMRVMPVAQERAILAPIFFIWVSVFCMCCMHLLAAATRLSRCRK